MRKMKIVIDTNVMVSAMRSRRGASFKLLSLIGDDLFDTFISVALLFEYEDVLKRNATVTISNDSIDAILDYFCLVGINTEIFYLWRPFLKDPKDDFVVELASNAHADFIITYNKKDFVTVPQLGIKVLDPKEFLTLIGEL